MKRKKALLIVVILAVSLCVFYPTYASPNTFGKTDVGRRQASEWNWGSKLGSRFQCPEEGMVTEIVWYGHVYPGSGSRTIYAAIYSDNDGVPAALLGYVSTTVTDTWQWWSFTGLSVSVSANSYYWLVINWDQFNIEYRYDTGVTRQYAYQGDQRDVPPPSDPFGGRSYRSRAMSIYAIYTPSGQDTSAPTYSNVKTNTTVAGTPCLFQAQWSDDFGLSGFIFGTNNSGIWQNDTWTAWTGTPTSGWSNAIKTLSDTAGIRVEYRFWCNDTSNNWGDTGVQYMITAQEPVRAVIIHSDFNYYYTMGEASYIFDSDAVVFGILQAAGIPYDIKPANEMADTNKLKDYSLIVFPEYFAFRLPENLTSAVTAACNEGVGVWVVGFAGEENENGLEVLPKFISQINNVVPFDEEISVLPQIVVNNTYLIDEYYSSGEILGVGTILGPQPLTQCGVYDPSRPYHEVISVFRDGGPYLGAGIVASTLGRGRTVWCGGGESLWKAQGILVRLIRWATKSPVFLELADSPATGVSLQIRIDGDNIFGVLQQYREFMWKIGNITDARVSLYIVTDDFDEECYSIARQYPKNEYGSHSRHHGWLPTLSPEDLDDEMNGSKTIIEANLGWEITGFAYPFNSYSKITTAGAGAYDYVYIGSEFNLSIAYPNKIWLLSPPDSKTTGLNTYSLFLTALNDYDLYWEEPRVTDPSAILQIWKNHFDHYAKQAEVGETNVHMNLLWHIKEMIPSVIGTTPYFDFLDWVDNRDGAFITAQELVQRVKELEAVNLQYKNSGNVISVTLDGSLSQGHPLRLFNSSDNIQSVTIDGQPWTNFRDKVVVLPSLGPGEHNIELTLGLAPTATIRGTVTDSETGNPIEGVNVTCDGDSALTMLDGTYSFTVNLGSYTLTFSKAGYIDQIKYQDCFTPDEYIVDVLLQPVPTATIRGIVTDFQTGNPIEGVTVTCNGKSAVTASDGSYSFIVNLGSYALTFEKTGYITTTRIQDCPTEGEYVLNVALEPVPTATIRGVVTDSGTGNPIQGVTVTCDEMSTQTASDGSYSFTVNLGSYTLTFSKIGYATETRTQNCPAAGEYLVNVSMRSLTATIRGTVTDSGTGAPIAEVIVTLDGTTSILTAFDGSYSFTVNLGSHTLTFAKSGYVTETRTQNCPTEGEYIVDVSLQLTPTTFGKSDVGSAEESWGSNYIIGSKFQLIEAGDVSKVSAYVATWGNIQVTAAIYEDNNGELGDLKAESNEVSVRGSFAWEDFTLSVSLDAGYYWLVLWSSGNIRFRYDSGASNQFVLHYQTGYNNWPDPFPSADYYLDLEMSIYATITASAAATISGIVTDSSTGTPIQGVNVACDGMSTLTASDGSYSFTVNLGSYSLTFSKEGYVDQIRYQNCPTPGEYIVDVLLQPVPTATIRGVVTDFQTGNPIAGVTVTCDGESTLTALDGSYSFTVLLGSYTLTFEKPGYITETRTQDCPTEGEYIVNVALEPVPTATIRGVVTDSDTGNPIQGVTVTCDGMSTQTASDGSYSFTVNLGSYTLTFSKTSYATETRTQDCPTVGEYIVNVSMTLLTATIRGIVTDSQTGAPIEGVNVTLDETTSALTALDGSYSFTVILGSHTLTFEKPGYVTETRTQDCPTVGEYIVNVSMTLLTATIRGIVTDSQTGDPIQGVDVTCDGTSTLTASDGSYSFIVNLGSYTLTFSKTEYVTETRNQDCPSEGEYIVNVALVPRTATITGTVTDSETGTPIDTVKVTANGYQTFTSSSGVYVLVVRLGTYTLTFSKPGYNTETTTVDCPTESTYTVDMSLRAGAKYLVDNNVGTTISLTHALGRKLFFANGRYWLFYGDGPDVVYRTSVDGESWSSKTIIKEEAQGWCVYVWHEYRGGTNYLHYAYSPEWYGMGIWYRRGIMNSGGTITWQTDEQLAVPGIPDVVGGFWGVVPDSNGYPFIIYMWYTTTHPWETDRVYVTKSAYNNGTWVTSSGFPKAVYDATANFRISAQIVPLTDGKMYIVYSPLRLYGSINLPVQGRLWDGSTLLAPEDISSGYQTSNLAFSTISLGDDVYLIYERELYSREMMFRGRHNGLWEPEEVVVPLVDYESFFACSIDAVGNFHVFWLQGNVRHIVRVSDGSWSDVDYPFGESFNFLSGDGKDNVACIPYVNSGTIVVAWLERGGSPYALHSGVLEYSTTESNTDQPLGSFATPTIMGGIIANPVALLYLRRKRKKNEAES